MIDCIWGRDALSYLRTTRRRNPTSRHFCIRFLRCWEFASGRSVINFPRNFPSPGLAARDALETAFQIGSQSPGGMYPYTAVRGETWIRIHILSIPLVLHSNILRLTATLRPVCNDVTVFTDVLPFCSICQIWRSKRTLASLGSRARCQDD